MNIIRLSRLLEKARGERGIREFARIIGISPATLSRVEGGKLPDLETFEKLCAALKIDPKEILEVGAAAETEPSTGTTAAPAAHFRSDAQYSQEAAQDLAALILAAMDFAKQQS
ncbi:MAG: helix-turn-helix domain-containing protein [Terriglobia bacterium]